MNRNEGLALAGELELTDRELETAHGGWGSPTEYEYVLTPYGWELVPVEPEYYGWNRGWGHDWDRGWGRGDRDDRHRRDGGDGGGTWKKKNP